MADTTDNFAMANEQQSNDRRSSNYAFTSERDLVSFFSTSLPKKLVKAVIKSVKADFVERRLTTPAARKLQFLKKCESELVKLSRDHEKVEEDVSGE